MDKRPADCHGMLVMFACAVMLPGAALLIPTCIKTRPSVETSESPNVQTETLEGDVTGPHTEMTGIEAALLLSRIEKLEATVTGIQTGDIPISVTVGGDGDSITSWILATGAAATPAGGFFYWIFLRPLRKRVWPDTEGPRNANPPGMNAGVQG